MMHFNWVLLCFMMTGILMSSSIAADIKSEVAVLDKYEGTVKHLPDGAVKGIKVRRNKLVLKVNDGLQTKRKSKAFLSLVDGSKIILTERSHIHFDGLSKVSTTEGRVLFHIQKKGGLKGFEIATGTAVIGVKGTKFLVDSQGDKLNVYMNEGVVSVEATKGQFKRYKQKQIDEFDAFQKGLTNEFEEYKKNLEEEFVEFVKSFDVKAGSAISIDGDELREVNVPDDVKELFELFNLK